MAGGRRKKTKNINNTNSHHLREKENEDESSNDLSSTRKRFVDMKKVDSSVITTKRLTVGIKGIFGNARSSNSVYRDIQERLESRKMSNDVTSEIEHNLSRILPNRKKCSSNDFQTPGQSSIASSRVTEHRSSIESSNTPSTCSSSCSTATPTFVQDELSRIANDIVTSIPSLKILKDYHLLESIRKDLHEMNQQKHKLHIIPKYEKEEIADEAPAVKKHCGDEQSPPPVTMNSQRNDSTQCSQNSNIVIVQPIEKDTRIQPPVEAMDHEPTHTTILPNGGAFNPFAISYVSGSDSHHFIQQPTANTDQHRDNAALPFAPNQREILSQPISSLRCNRRRRPASNFSINDHMYEPSSDLLDYIDNLPFQALENRLLGRCSTRTRVPAAADNPHDPQMESLKAHHVTVDLQKPSLDSPSPPKLYRMNMF